MSNNNSLKELYNKNFNDFIHPDVFFRIFTKHIKTKGDWLVNLEMLVNKEVKMILDGKIPEHYITGKEIHISFMNLEDKNFASMKLVDVLNDLHRIFKNNKYKYTIILENCDHSTKTLRNNLDFKELEERVKLQKWWRLVFLNDGLKTKFSKGKGNKLSKVKSNIGKENSSKGKDYWKKQMILKRKEKKR